MKRKYYKTGELSKIYNLGRDSLKYYEKLGLLNPGRDTNSYRMYTIKDICNLNLIKELRSLDFSMQKIKEYLENRNVDTTREMLLEEVRFIDEKLKELSSHKESLHKRLSSINNTVEHTNFNRIELLYMPKRKVLTVNSNVTFDENVDYLIQRLNEKFDDKFYVLGNSNFGAVFDTKSVTKGVFNNYKYIFCLLDDDAKNYDFIIDEGYYVTYTYKGNYKQIRKILPMLFKFIEFNNYTILGDPLEIYKIDIYETSIEDEYVTQVQIPVKLLSDIYDL
ncbi:MerR family transcriptional regulator [[Clostridium] sordellii]|uniref:Transcriptional regulator, MerR family n=1 Tax=Paraclostridium sordellii TaxID=1505 RepID=A0ABM9RQ25_PARSO|nr:MerR family transcriptional regulator [Paeniclostridium sordellii]CEJ74109.1 Transcriptional regulator, MerR family [[Clostridium] sordellii] [Paeniclostridium sordellii]CEN69654.1 MerR family transcriptional regulator [[Clostridium] sordellii] [Paeniclostridium sordellii]CEN72922.1 MerR family transcriptional regulator [[Clostridium] sordellii] [Paeniclostridium sordellii]CEO25250.1 MerR family transcriptional regulator [[Clostridium] sordellii] [Paeniclostridium sordellii]CEP75485.1 MerR 